MASVPIVPTRSDSFPPFPRGIALGNTQKAQPIREDSEYPDSAGMLTCPSTERGAFVQRRTGMILGAVIFVAAIADWILRAIHYAELIEKTLPWTQHLFTSTAILITMAVGVLVFAGAWGEWRNERNQEKLTRPVQQQANPVIQQQANPVNAVNVSPSFQIHNYPPAPGSGNETSLHSAVKAEQAIRPNLRSEPPRDHYLKLAESDFGDCLEEATDGPYRVTGFFAVFHNDPVTAQPTEADDVLVRISFYHRGNVLEPPQVIDSGCWYFESDQRVSISVGETVEVCIAAIGDGGKPFAIGNKRIRLDDGTVLPRPAPMFALEHKEYDVEAKLIYGYDGRFFDAFWFEFIGGPDLELKRQNEPSWIRTARRR